MTGVDSIAKSVQTTDRWLAELGEELGTEDRREALRVLRAVLHALRDRIGTDEAAQLASQLPLVVRGLYYENWRPSAASTQYHDVDTFLRRVADEGRLSGETEASFAAAAVWRLLARHVSEGELADVLAVLPAPLRGLLTPNAPATADRN